MGTPNDDFMKLARSLVTHRYQTAKTMPKNPHQYTLRRDWDDSEFVETVELLRKYGYQKWYWGKEYTCFDVNDFYYWTMGEPIDKDGKPWTYIINRAKRSIDADYDTIADSYDGLFSSDEYKKEDADVIGKIGFVGGSVLDIGCGTGLFLEHCDPEFYVGIEPSSKMLEIAKAKSVNGERLFVNTDFESYYSPRKFDLAIALFGSTSYIEPETVKRVEAFSRASFLMFFKDGYFPVTHEKTGIRTRYSTFSAYKDVLDGYEFEEMGCYIIARR